MVFNLVFEDLGFKGDKVWFLTLYFTCDAVFLQKIVVAIRY